MLRTAGSIILLITELVKSDTSYLMSYPTLQLAGIQFDMIVIRVAMSSRTEHVQTALTNNTNDSAGDVAHYDGGEQRYAIRERVAGD